MPSAVPYTPRGFVPGIHQPRGRLGDYARAHGRDQADAIRRGGEISANLWSGIGQNVAGSLRDIAAHPEQQRQAQMMAVKQQREEAAYQEAQAAKQTEEAKAQRLRQLVQEHGGQRVPTPILLQEFGPEDASEIDAAFDELFPKVEPPKTREVKVRNADGSESIQIVEDTPGQTFSSAAPVKDPKTYQVTVPGPNGQPMTRLATEEEMAKGVPTYRAPVQGPAPRAKFWVIRDGKQLRISEDEYQPGDQNASTREQGRPVTSGDAGRIAEFDTSLDDLGVLSSILGTSGSTGTAAKIGASVPNWVTEFSGWGSDAKKKQALIDRVKQVIGKALEGGVLRKEDEIKYEKILPTVGDPNDLVVSKLSGLADAIKLRRTRTIESLGDAGYDTSKFGEYKSKLNTNKTAVPDLSGLRPGAGRRFTEGPFKGQTWSVDEQGRPYKVGG
jgi:hypothetical protein